MLPQKISIYTENRYLYASMRYVISDAFSDECDYFEILNLNGQNSKHSGLSIREALKKGLQMIALWFCKGESC